MDSFLKEAYEEKAKLMLEVDPKVKISAINEDIQVEENLQPATLLPNEPAEEKVGRLVSKVRSVEKLEEIKVAERGL
jgi:ACT domain-containing protein